MRVLQFRMLCDTGGVSSSMLLLGQQMAERGIECEYWFCRPSKRLPDFMATGHATLGQMSALGPRLDRGDFDVVQMTASDPGAELVAQMAAGRARVVVTSRGALSDVWNHRNCFAYSAISKGMAEINQPYTDVAIEVIRNSINLGRFAPGASSVSGPPIVAFVGRTTSNEKDFPRFTRIAKRLMDRGARVWIADPHEGSWEKFEGQPVERIVPERWAPVPHAEMADFYRAVAASGGVVLMTSRTEGFGNVAPEAAACGARVAAPNVMGLREAIIDGVTGCLFDANASDDEVAEMLSAWMASTHDGCAVADAARREFAPSIMMDAYEKIYARREPLLLTHRVPVPAPTSETPILVEHLAKQRRWRANFAWGSAMDMARAGQHKQARSALALALRTAPREFANRTSVRALFSMTRTMLFGGKPPVSVSGS